MKYNVIGYSNEVLGEVEANDNVEAWSEAGKRFENILDVREVGEPTLLSVGMCLMDNFAKSLYKVVKIVDVPSDPSKRYWYKIRQFDTGLARTIPEGYIPYSYSVIQCPNYEIPKPPFIRVGDLVRWKVKEGYEEGIVLSIVDDEVGIETKKEFMGVRGWISKDVYELEKLSSS